MFYNWIWHRDQDGNHFDLREDATVPEGSTPVKDYPVYRGMTGREGKPALDLRGDDGNYASKRKGELEDEIARRNAEAAAVETPLIEVPTNATKATLVDLLEAHDTAIVSPADTTEDESNAPDDTSDTGANTTTDADELGKESE